MQGYGGCAAIETKGGGDGNTDKEKVQERIVFVSYFFCGY